MAFSRAEDMRPDEERGDGLLRAPSFETLKEYSPDRFRVTDCEVRDCDGSQGIDASLHDHGFAHADLSHLDELQAALERVHRAGRVEPPDVAAIRRAIVHRSIPLSGGARLRLFYVAPEGFIMRRAGPNGLCMVEDRVALEINDHEAALNVHVDQDVHGTPIRQIMRGAAPWLFHHDSPTAQNLRSPLFLVNVWVPLNQITRPLTLADRQSLDRRAHQVRMGLPTQELFTRSEDRRFNDLYSFLHHPEQRWFFTAEMDSSRAYVFETLSTPHGSCILPGEAHAETLFLALGVAMGAVERGDAVALRDVTGREHGRPPRATAPLQRAMAEMSRVLEEAHREADALCAPGSDTSGWTREADEAREAVVRKSVEMRAVGLVTRSRAPRRLPSARR